MTEEASQIGALLKAARESAGFSQAAAAAKLDVDTMTISRWERGKHRPPGPALIALAGVYGVDVSMFGEQTEQLDGIVSEPRERWDPNPSLRGVVPARVYDVVMGYCRRLAAAGLPPEDIEEAERLLIDEGYAKINKRARRVLSEDEQIQIIDATWTIMQEVLSWKGVRA